MIAGKDYCATGRVMTLRGFGDGVEFIELDTADELVGARFIVSGANREQRDNACRRFIAATVECGCKFGDVVITDIDECEHE